MATAPISILAAISSLHLLGPHIAARFLAGYDAPCCRSSRRLNARLARPMILPRALDGSILAFGAVESSINGHVVKGRRSAVNPEQPRPLCHQAPAAGYREGPVAKFFRARFVKELRSAEPASTRPGVEMAAVRNANLKPKVRLSRPLTRPAYGSGKVCDR